MRRLFAVLALTALLTRPAAAKDDLVIGITQFPVTFNPAIESMLAKTYILAFAQRPVTIYDASWRLSCLLCETVPSLENGLARLEPYPGGRTGMAVTYTFKPGLTWADGHPITSEDVVFSWQVGRHPQSGVASGELFKRILRVTIKDARTFTIHLDRVTFDYAAINDLHLLPAHMERSRFEDAPAEYRNRTAYDQDTTNPGLYNGPYRIAQVAQGSHVVLERNAHWTGPKPAFNRIVVKVVENTAAMEANLLSGGVDMIAGELGLPLDQALALDKRHDPRFTVTFKPSLAYEHLELNLGSPILSDLRVRRALLLGLDRETLTRQLFDGHQPVAHSEVPPPDWVHADDIPRYDHDAAKAAALLEAAGWKRGPGGVRVNKAGERLALELVTTAGNRSREMVAQVIQSQWRKLGVDLRLKLEPPRVMFGETVTKRKFPHMAMFAWYSAPESVPHSTLHSDAIPTAENSWSGQNYSGYSSLEMDHLIDSIETELDRAKRKALWHELQVLYAADLPALPLYFKADAFILPKTLKGLVPTGHQDPTPYWVENWRWQP